MKITESYENFFNVIKRLRAPDGCPWDRAQTPLTMRTDLIEETFEAVEAIGEQDSEHVKEELGDVLLNATMIAYMYEQIGDFAVSDVLDELSEKLIRRHPHVFKESSGKSEMKKKVETPDQVLSQWDLIKNNVEGRKKESVLDSVSDGMPPLLKGYKYQKKAAKLGFEWNNNEEVYSKILEEIDEVKEAVSLSKDDKDKLHVEEEIGDLLFAVVNLSRRLNVDPTVAMARANDKFKNRFSFIESEMKKQDIPMNQQNVGKMLDLWNEAKKLK